MADENYLHTAQIMKAALPYVDVRTKTTMEFMYKFLDLMDSLDNYTKPKPDLAACGYQNPKINMEGLLTGIRPFCNDKEKSIIDRILNIFNMKRMFETYKSYMAAMQAMQGTEGGFPFGSSQAGASSEGSPFNFAGMDLSTLFNSLNSMNNGLNNSATSASDGSTNKAPASESSPPNNQESSVASFLKNLASSEDNFSKQQEASEDSFSKYHEASEYSFPKNQETFEKNHESFEKNHETFEDSFSKMQDASERNGISENSQNTNLQDTDTKPKATSNYEEVINMLKSMIPPDQKDAYENASMLLHDKTYDDNSKNAN